MEKYDNLGLVGEGSYGIVMKCRHKASGTLVAIKKFLESEEDRVVKRIANREIKMLRQLRHENLVNLIDVFKRKKKLYLVFEFVDYTLLDDLEKNTSGLEESYGKKILFQVLRGIEFCHNNDVIHRDIKPENILVSKSGIVKLCDFGFARPLTSQSNSFTDYVATRWYRAPELLVGDTKYGRPVDIWAIGCLTSEIFSGDPLFPGDSDIDQLFHIIKCIGSICPKHVDIFKKNVLFKGLKMPEINERFSLEKRYVKMQKDVITIIKRCLDPTPEERPSCSELLNFELFNNEFFSKIFINEIKMKVFKERERNPLLKNAFKSRASFSKNENFTFETNYKSPADKSPNQKRNSITLKQNPPLNENLKPDDLMYSENIISNQENEIVEPNIPTTIVDENTWEDVKLLTSRKERVASRAGRISVMKDAFINTEASEDTIDNTLQQSETPAMMDVPRPISNMVSSIEGDLDTKLPLNNDLSFNRLDNISKIHSSSSNIVSSEDDVNKSSGKVLATNLMQLKSVDNTQQEKAPLDVNANGSSPILNDIIVMQPTPNISILSKKNHLCTLNNSNNINTFITSKHAPYNYPTLYQNYGSNPSLNFNVIKQMSTNFSQRALGVPSENAFHSYFPNIGKDVKIRSNNFHFPAMAQSNKAFLNNNTNTGLKSPSPLTNERSGFYFNGLSKKKTFNNIRSTVIAYQDHNIILPELKGSEIPISRNQLFNPNTKYKYITQKVNNNSADPQNDKPHDP